MLQQCGVSQNSVFSSKRLFSFGWKLTHSLAWVLVPSATFSSNELKEVLLKMLANSRQRKWTQESQWQTMSYYVYPGTGVETTSFSEA